jgi:acyl carrier protein
MASSALVPQSSGGSLENQICTFIAQYLKVNVHAIEARLSLTDDLGLDLLDITELMIVLEQQFCPKGAVTVEPNEIEIVDDLINHIQQNTSRNQLGAS